MWAENCWLMKSKSDFIETGQYHMWVGLQNLLWSTARKKYNISTWIYEKNDKFYIEITPTFNWSAHKSRYPQKKYLKFIENYKPYVKTEISKEQLEKWLENATKLWNQIESNDAEFLAGYYKNNKSKSYCNLYE